MLFLLLVILNLPIMPPCNGSIGKYQRWNESFPHRGTCWFDFDMKVLVFLLASSEPDCKLALRCFLCVIAPSGTSPNNVSSSARGTQFNKQGFNETFNEKSLNRSAWFCFCCWCQEMCNPIQAQILNTLVSTPRLILKKGLDLVSYISMYAVLFLKWTCCAFGHTLRMQMSL